MRGSGRRQRCSPGWCAPSAGRAILTVSLYTPGVDSSAPALELARQNAVLNGLSEESCDFQQADIMDFMKASG